MAYRIARRSPLGALAVLVAALFAGRRRERLGTRDEYATGPSTRLRGRVTVKQLAEYVYNHPSDLIASVDLAQAVLEYIAREEGKAP